jgi:hypothetical protein
MKVIILSIIGISLSVFAKAQFSGVIKMKATDHGNSANIEYHIQLPKVALVVNTPETPIRMIMDKSKGEVIMLTEEGGNKVGVKTKAMQEQASNDVEKLEFTITKESKKILGYNCLKSVLKQGNEIIEYWSTDELQINFIDVFSGMMKFSNQMKDANDLKIKQYFEKNFPLEIITKDHHGHDNGALVTEIRQGKVNPEMFSTKGFTITEMDNMFGQ